MALRFDIIRALPESPGRFLMPLPKPGSVFVTHPKYGECHVQAFTDRNGTYFAFEFETSSWKRFEQKEVEELMLFYVEISRAMRGHFDTLKETRATQHKAGRGKRGTKTAG